MRLEIVCGTFGQQFLEVFNDCLWVLSELDVKLLYFLYSSKVHIITPKLEIKLQFAITRKLNTNQSQILRISLNSNLN